MLQPTQQVVGDAPKTISGLVKNICGTRFLLPAQAEEIYRLHLPDAGRAEVSLR